MEDEVKFIFKSLIKVPIIIIVCYLILNVFAFTFTYFRLLGVSYVVMQTVVENNFIPVDEGDILIDYVQSLKTGMLDSLQISCDVDETSATASFTPLVKGTLSSKNHKVQYGRPITVSVSGRFKWIMPIPQSDPSDGVDRVTAYDPYGITSGGAEDSGDPNIRITYTVPGLRYYPDL